MHDLIYKHKNLILKIKRVLNYFSGIDIIGYPTLELQRRIKLMNHHSIDVILDVGANIGDYAKDMRNIGFKGEIFSFEPVKEVFDILLRDASKDKLWKVFNYAIWEKDGEATINISKNLVSSSLLNSLPQLVSSAPRANFVLQEKIKIQKLDSIFDDLKLRDKKIYLKIDTQGYEEMVLLGANKSLEFISGIQIEMPLIPSYVGSMTFDKMKQKLNMLGFRLVAVENGFYNKKTGEQIELDGIFYRDNLCN